MNSRTIASLSIVALLTACSEPGMLAQETTCQDLFEGAFPLPNDRQLWTAGYDGTPPSDWDAYKRAGL